MPGAKCWVCRRTDEDLKSAFDHATPVEYEIQRLMERVGASAAEFDAKTRKWARSAPSSFTTLDFVFVLNNSSQFKNLGIVDDITRAKKALVDPLAAAYATKVDPKGEKERVRNEGMVSLGAVDYMKTDPMQKEAVERTRDDFERRMGLRVGDPRLFDGRKFPEGLALLREVGMLYFSTQRGVLGVQLEQEKGKRPRFGVEMVKLKQVAVPIPLCTVCDGLMRNPTRR